MKLYDKYIKLKSIYDSKKYLFKSENFYIFLDKDTIVVSKVDILKVTSFGNIVKCVFSVVSLDKYLKIFMNIIVDIVVVERFKFAIW